MVVQESAAEAGLSYGELFAYALRSYGILLIGLYRFRDALTSVTQDPASGKRYVITNPPDDFPILTSDKVHSAQMELDHIWITATSYQDQTWNWVTFCDPATQ